MQERTFEKNLPLLREGVSGAGQRPNLLYGPSDLKDLRERMGAHAALSESISRRASEILKAGDFSVKPEPYYILGRLDVLVAEEMLRPSAQVEEHMLRLLRAICEAPTWVAHVHGGMKCDHCTGNTAAAIALAMESLGRALTPSDEAWLTERVREHCFVPFLDCCRQRSVFWAQREHQFNWRIMTCGEAGLAALGFNAPERAEVVEFAFEGVADILDRVPPDGDWEEGPGYWAATLLFGLRFALALKRATGGRVDLMRHPALQRTADYFTCVTLPDGSAFNYADNGTRITPAVVHILARELRCRSLAWTARRIGHDGVWDVLFDDPSLPSEQPPDELKARVFRTTGIAVSRSDWSENAAYVGLKSGPTAVGHSHLDIQSFIVWKGAPLITDLGCWPYGSFLGFFESGPPGRRWDFDANATVAHNTVLVDGRGQTFGPECVGRIVASGTDAGLSFFVSDGAPVYPGLLTKFERWLVHAAPEVILLYDDLASDQPRRWQWLLHPAGSIKLGRVRHVIENAGARLLLERLLPAADAAWRNVEETRASYYEDSNGLADTHQIVRTYRLGPMMPSERMEFLWAMQVGKAEPMKWTLQRESDDVFVVRGGSLAVRFDRPAHKCKLV